MHKNSHKELDNETYIVSKTTMTYFSMQHNIKCQKLKLEIPDFQTNAVITVN